MQRMTSSNKTKDMCKKQMVEGSWMVVQTHPTTTGT